METRASYILVGVFVLSLIAGLFVFTVWIAKVQLDEQRDPYRIYFTGSVTGLQSGSPVRYRGIPVGTVTDIRLDPANVERVMVGVELQEGTPIKTDSIASLEMQGITGGAYVQITGGTDRSERLTAEDNGVPVIRSRPSTLAEVVDTAPQLLNRIVGIAERVDALLGPDNQQAIAGILANSQAITGQVAAATRDLGRVMAGVERLVATLDATVGDVAPELRRTVSQATDTLATLDGTARTLGEEVGTLTRTLSVAAERLGAMVEENREPVRDFTATGLYEVTLLVTQLRDLSAQLSRVVTRIENSPTNFLFGGTRQGVEVGQ